MNGNQSNNFSPESGAAYVFVRSGTTWSQQAYLKASNTNVNFQFGWSCSVNEDTLVVGSPGEASDATGVNGSQNNINAPNSGAAYVFIRTGTTWSQQAYLKASNTDVLDQFGLSVSVSGETVVVGAYGEDSNATGVNGNQSNNGAVNSGAAYVFVRSGSTWSQQAYVKASNTGDDLFGESVSVSGNTVVVGARYEESNATGVNGNQNNNSSWAAGAAYVFARSGTTWSQQAYLKASNTRSGDYFGFSVSVSGDTVVVGAFGEDSNATGVNGDQSNGSAGTSGAAYLFQVGVASDWTNTTPSPTTAVARAGHSMCFDPTSGTVLMFGGKTGGASGPDTNEIWSYNGIAWSPLTPVGVLPPPTTDAEFVYDSNRGVFVTHGGTPPGPAADRTWEYNPLTNSWVNLLLPTTPGGLASYGMAFDSANNKIVLYGGLTGGSPAISDDTWEYDGVNWAQVTTSGSPGPIERPGMCFHAGLGVTVMFGGGNGGAIASDQTWLFTSTGVGTGTWTQAPIIGVRPPGRADCRMVYDGVRQICVMTAGENFSQGHSDDTWELDLAT